MEEEKGGRWDLNPRHLEPQSSALPLRHAHHTIILSIPHFTAVKSQAVLACRRVEQVVNMPPLAAESSVFPARNSVKILYVFDSGTGLKEFAQ